MKHENEETWRQSHLADQQLHQLLLSIVRAGVEVHTISDGQVYRKGEMDVQKMIWSIFVLARSGEESKRKSERCASAAEQQRLAARKGNVITAHVPGWLKAKKGGKIEAIPRHSATVRRIFEMAANGIGATRIVDLLNEGNAPPWTLSGR